MSIPQRNRQTVYLRTGMRCDRCGTSLHGQMASLHHRTPRGMGGTKDPAIHSPANLLALCGSGTTGCHGWVEHNREEARQLGFLVTRGVDPETVPVRLHTGWALLLRDGSLTRTANPG